MNHKNIMSTNSVSIKSFEFVNPCDGRNQSKESEYGRIAKAKTED
ncbi:MAG: hypothetical protein K0R19_2302 [Bacillota bacterium]|nr:hypothetical protein [Bacillota bacterium]